MLPGNMHQFFAWLPASCQLPGCFGLTIGLWGTATLINHPVIWLPASWFTAATILKVLAAVRALSPDVLEIPTNNFRSPWWSELNCHGKRGKNDKMSKAVEISCVHFYRKWEIRYNWMDRLTELDGLKERWRIISYGTRGLIHFMGAGAGRPH